jgi:hypothetical protein
MANAGGQPGRGNGTIGTFRENGQGWVEVYDVPLTCTRLHLEEVPGNYIFIFVSNSQAKEAVAFQAMRLDRVSRAGCSRYNG